MTGVDQGWSDRMLEELRENLKRFIPEVSMLSSSLERTPGAEGLTLEERLSVIRGLERVWHIMKLLRVLNAYFAEKIFFGGGAVINFLYMVKFGEPPRLTFDLDCSWYRRVYGKRVLLAEMVMFNRWLDEMGLTLKIPVDGGKTVNLFIVEYDVDKDYFPEVLSLRMPTITRHDGVPFYKFLNLRDHRLIVKLRDVFHDILGVRNPRIDYLRFEISLTMAGAPVEQISMNDLFNNRHDITITKLEYQLASKIVNKVGKDFGEYIQHNIPDILKALVDLRLLDYTDPSSVSTYIENKEHVKQVSKKNINTLLTTGRDLWERSYHYTMLRKKYTLEEITGRVANLLSRL